VTHILNLAHTMPKEQGESMSLVTQQSHTLVCYLLVPRAIR